MYISKVIDSKLGGDGATQGHWSEKISYDSAKDDSSDDKDKASKSDAWVPKGENKKFGEKEFFLSND